MQPIWKNILLCANLTCVSLTCPTVYPSSLAQAATQNEQTDTTLEINLGKTQKIPLPNEIISFALENDMTCPRKLHHPER